MKSKEARINSIAHNRNKYREELESIFKVIERYSKRGYHSYIYYAKDSLDKWDVKGIKEVLREDGYIVSKGVDWDTVHIKW